MTYHIPNNAPFIPSNPAQVKARIDEQKAAQKPTEPAPVTTEAVVVSGPVDVDPETTPSLPTPKLALRALPDTADAVIDALGDDDGVPTDE